LSPSIGHHRSTLIEISVNHNRIDENRSWLIQSCDDKSDVKQMSFYRIAQILNDEENIRRIEIYDQNPDEQQQNQTRQYRFSANSHLTNCSTIKITIKRTHRLTSCALKYLQIWGTYSNSIPSTIKSHLQSLISPPIQSPSVAAAAAIPSKEIPSEFLDELTNELMIIPMLLPSGHLIDRTSLEKCVNEDMNLARLPRDPFTLESFTDRTQPVVAQNLKIRIDQFLSDHQNDPKYSHHRRLLDARQPIRNETLNLFKRKLSTDDNKIDNKRN